MHCLEDFRKYFFKIILTDVFENLTFPLYGNKPTLSNKTITSIICDCYIREYYEPQTFELDLQKRKSSNLDKLCVSRQFFMLAISLDTVYVCM